jgi:diguanylate cyclase (GGDEF)-like protein/PAS domain S-box-containing protein
LARPVLQMRDASLAIGQGRFDTRVAVQSHDEMGELADSINQMAQALDEITVSKSYVDSILHSMADGLIVADEQGCVVLANPAALQMLQYDADSIQTVPLERIAPELFVRQDDGRVVLRRRTLPIARHEMSFCQHSGASVLVSVSVSSDDAQGKKFVLVAQDITARRAAEAEIHALAFYDPLTNLPNRRLLLDRLEQALVQGARSPQYGALLMLDLDNFKMLNDTHGHEMGDLMLIEVADRLSSGLRAEDTVARLGGDEFVVLLNHLGTDERAAASQAALIAQNICHRLSHVYVLRHDAPIEHHASASIGLTLLCGGAQDSVKTILKQADSAMYQAKEAGRNTVRCHAVNGANETYSDERNAIS